jgi:thioredoxin reductase
MNMETQPYDVAVIGGGAAGISAALVLGRARRRVVVIDGGAPRNAPAAHMQGYLSRDGMAPSELLAIGRREASAYGVELVSGVVERIAGRFEVHLDDGRTIRSRRVLVTTGLVDGLPDIPGVRDRWGRDLLHCPYCHGWEVRDQPLGVLGTNPGSIAHAQLVRQWSNDVVYFCHTQEPTEEEAAQLTARGIRIAAGQATGLAVKDDRLVGVEMADGTVVARTAVFIRPELAPRPGGLLKALGCDLDEFGFPMVDRTGLTSVTGVWAAGNAADPRAQVITAAGQGSAAAIAINADLVVEEIAAAVASSGSVDG